MLSTAARRSVIASSRMAKNTFSPAAASFSTQTYKQVETVEDMLKNLRWSDVKDEMKCIKSIMNEGKTNHAIRQPDATFEQRVEADVSEIQNMIATNPNHDEVWHRIHDLKMEVKGQLYQFAWKAATTTSSYRAITFPLT